MKLEDILARHLKEWPEGVEAIAQDLDWCAHPYATARGLKYNGFHGCWRGIFTKASDCVHMPSLAEDYSTAIVIKEVWRAARNRAALEHYERVKEEAERAVEFAQAPAPIEDQAQAARTYTADDMRQAFMAGRVYNNTFIKAEELEKSADAYVASLEG